MLPLPSTASAPAWVSTGVGPMRWGAGVSRRPLAHSLDGVTAERTLVRHAALLLPGVGCRCHGLAPLSRLACALWLWAQSSSNAAPRRARSRNGVTKARNASTGKPVHCDVRFFCKVRPISQKPRFPRFPRFWPALHLAKGAVLRRGFGSPAGKPRARTALSPSSGGFQKRGKRGKRGFSHIGHPIGATHLR